jgi:exopolysaccharide biosynthesis predicted pyruvyltransferase EpsI
LNQLNHIEKLGSELASTAANIYNHASNTDVLDFPDHSNVGDSAIFLGEIALLSKLDIEVNTVQSINSMRWDYEKFSESVTFHGGGNLGGLYPTFDSFRIMQIDKLPATHSIVVMPQSVGLEDPFIFEQYKTVTRGKNVTFMARDFQSKKIMDSYGLANFLAPDAVHCLGFIQSSPPTKKFIVLKRTDGESKADRGELLGVDWLRDDLMTRTLTKLRQLSRLSTRASEQLNISPDFGLQLARTRFERGVSLLSQGETIVTDRLHAMLLGLQMGRNVIAIDNAHKKLSNYADTWELGKLGNLEFRNTFKL